jgi:hypothetical protein
MNFQERAKIRMEHWVSHDQEHLAEYLEFAQQLNLAGLSESAAAIQEMAGCMAQGMDCLQRALAALDKGEADG